MALAAKLQLRQSQSLVMTPQLMQSIRLLQFTHVELERFIDEEIERNPLLERAEPQDDAAGDQAQNGEAASGRGRRRRLVRERDGDWSAEAISEKLDTSLENLFPDDPGTAERLGPDLTAQWKSAVRQWRRRIVRGLRPRRPGGGRDHTARPCRRADRASPLPIRRHA